METDRSASDERKETGGGAFLPAGEPAAASLGTAPVQVDQDQRAIASLRQLPPSCDRC